MNKNNFCPICKSVRNPNDNFCMECGLSFIENYNDEQIFFQPHFKTANLYNSVENSFNRTMMFSDRNKYRRSMVLDVSRHFCPLCPCLPSTDFLTRGITIKRCIGSSSTSNKAKSDKNI